ncbi:MAG TPA: NADH-quinone oxidoreductase subunit C [Candidatus Binataceae bacterium]|nr:NADH-quinone oxidoreductase subunit C [Candidatus Binataceae bacterium]
MLIEKLKERFGAAISEAGAAHGQEFIVVARDSLLEILRALATEPGFEFNSLSDLTAVDWPERKPRFEVVYNLNSLTRNHRVRVKVPIPGDDAWVASAISVWRAADWLERECYDMFGIDFRGHPDLRRILLYDTFEGHPLRKDYPYQKRQPIVPEVDSIVNPIPMSR